MKKIVVVSDSFKGTLSSLEICNIAHEIVPEIFPESELITIPIADGGEGTVDCFINAMGAIPVYVEVSGPYMEKITARYAIINNTAIIEMAAVAGLPLVGNRKNPGATTTYGVGELIKHAIRNGCTEVLLGLGGSATNDGGCGCACALGTRFLSMTTSGSSNCFIPTGNTLWEIAGIDTTETKKLLNGISITAMSDVTNVLCGKNGAAFVFGPQKGADTEMVKILDDGLKNMAHVIRKNFGINLLNTPGAGAAGGMGAGCLAFLGARIESGISSILDAIGFSELIKDADLVITGEGCTDGQSANGKVISGVGIIAKQASVPVIVLSGSLGKGAEEVYRYGVQHIFTTSPAGMSMEEIIPRAKDDYSNALRRLLIGIKGGKILLNGV